jgi:hypothetical protein
LTSLSCTVLPFCRGGSRDQELSETEKQKKIRILETRLRLLERRPEEEFRSVSQNKLYLLLIFRKKNRFSRSLQKNSTGAIFYQFISIPNRLCFGYVLNPGLLIYFKVVPYST